MYYCEALCREKHPARWLWRIGDLLYYLGLLLAVSSIPSLFIAPFFFGWYGLLALPIIFSAGALTWFIGSLLKGFSYSWGERDGISAAEEYKRVGTTSAP
jgi:hypothetical protein